MDVNTILHASLANSFTAGASLLLLGLLAHSVYSIFDKSSLKSYPGPLFARLSDLWLTWITARGRVNRVVAEAHKVYGPFVRIAPNHISISDPAALQAVYGHSNGAHKSDFYDVFASFGGRRAVFTTRTPAEHGRKRKLISNTFSQKTTLEFEPVVRQYIGGLVKQWDRMCAAATKGNSGIIGDMDWASDRGYAVFDTLKWYTFMLFDITGDLVFRAPFGMTERGTDVARVAKRAEDAISKYSSAEVELEYDTIKAVDDVNARATLLVTTGMLPASWRGFVKQLPIPIFRRGNLAFKKLGSMAATAVAHRTQHEASRGDILSKYFEATDEQGNPMDSHEISIEALGLLVAGTDTTSNSMAAITFYLSQNPAVQAKLQQELDGALGAPRPDDDEEHPSLVPYDKIKNLPYLNDCVNEGLRLFSTVGLGLPREVGPEGLTVLGHTFAPGTVVSVPTFVVHRDPEVWGEDAEEFNPERWSTGDKAAMTKAFQPFSLGTRGCIGRNLASMELLMLISNVFYRYETAPAYPGSQMTIVDGLIRKPDSTFVSVKRRAC